MSKTNFPIESMEASANPIIRPRDAVEIAIELRDREQGIDAPYLGWVSPLIWAIGCADASLVRAMLAAGADPGYAPFNHAAPIALADSVYRELAADGDPQISDAVIIKQLLLDALVVHRDIEKGFARA